MDLQRIYLMVAQAEFVRTHVAVAAANLPRLHQIARHRADARTNAIPKVRGIIDPPARRFARRPRGCG